MKRPLVYLTHTELQQFFKALYLENRHHLLLYLRNRALYYLMYLYGLRIIEAPLLQRSGVDFKRWTIRIDRNRPTARNTHPLPASAHRILKDYLDMRKDRDDWLFFRVTKSRAKDRTLPLHPVTVVAHFRQVTESMGWPPEKQNPSILRQSILAHLIEAGLPEPFISQYLGNQAPAHKKPQKHIDNLSKEVYNPGAL